MDSDWYEVIAMMDHRVEYIIALMNENYRNNPSLAELAKAVNVSKCHVCHLFKAATGTTLAQYIKSMKLRRAKELLEGTNLTIKEIRMIIGVSDESHFLRDFKKAVGVSPTQYRKTHHVIRGIAQRKNR